MCEEANLDNMGLMLVDSIAKLMLDLPATDRFRHGGWKTEQG